MLGQREDHSRKYKYTRGLLFLIVLVGGLVGHIWQMSLVSRLSLEVAELESKRAKIEEKRSYLRAEAASLTDGRRITRIAQQKLDMVFPQGPPIEILLEDR